MKVLLSIIIMTVVLSFPAMADIDIPTSGTTYHQNEENGIVTFQTYNWELDENYMIHIWNVDGGFVPSGLWLEPADQYQWPTFGGEVYKMILSDGDDTPYKNCWIEEDGLWRLLGDDGFVVTYNTRWWTETTIPAYHKDGTEITEIGTFTPETSLIYRFDEYGRYTGTMTEAQHNEELRKSLNQF